MTSQLCGTTPNSLHKPVYVEHAVTHQGMRLSLPAHQDVPLKTSVLLFFLSFFLLPVLSKPASKVVVTEKGDTETQEMPESTDFIKLSAV